MKIKFSTLRLYGHALAILAIPIVILDFSEPSWWTSTDSGIAFGILCILAGVPPFLFWTRIVKIEFLFSEKEKQKTAYKLWKSYCEASGRSLSDGSRQSKTDK
jgi:hypothetical protein